MNELAERTPILIATEINSIKSQTQKMLLINSIEIGRRLVEAKHLVPHGEWGKWLEEKVDYSQRTANNLMKIFEQYGNDQISLFDSSSKSQTLANLSYTQAVALLGVPDEEREDFVKKNDVENMSTRELQQAIKEKQELEKKLKEADAAAKKEKLAREKLAKENEKLAKLKEELESANSTDNSAELQQEIKEKEKLLLDSQNKIKDLERQLKEKPIDVPSAEIIEKIPEEVEQELTQLREKLAKQGEGKAVTKFTVCFENLVKNFSDLLGALSEINEPEVKDKYRNAVTGLINKMSEKL